jgi:hypothetical protein
MAIVGGKAYGVIRSNGPPIVWRPFGRWKMATEEELKMIRNTVGLMERSFTDSDHRSESRYVLKLVVIIKTLLNHIEALEKKHE